MAGMNERSGEALDVKSPPTPVEAVGGVAVFVGGRMDGATGKLEVIEDCETPEGILEVVTRTLPPPVAALAVTVAVEEAGTASTLVGVTLASRASKEREVETQLLMSS